MTSKKDESMKMLEESRSQMMKEIDQYLNSFYKRRDLIKQALKEKIQLRKHKIGVARQIVTTNIRFLASIPFIYGLIIPAIILHVFLEVYHRICFPLYGVKPLRTRDYFVFDRHHLSYLNWFEKLNCIYCSYFNCLIAYAREISSLTELYWCPIKHARRVFGTHEQYHLFVDYLDAKAYRKKIDQLQHIAKKGGIKKPDKSNTSTK